MRLFIAIELNKDMKVALLEMQSSMKRSGMKGNFTPIDNTHITLAFIGEYPDPDYVLDAMNKTSFSSFNISLQGFGNFGDLWWAGLSKSEELQSYVRQLRHCLTEADIPYDRKKFSPHITLVRKAYCPKGTPKVYVPEVTMEVNSISLYRSDFGKNRMVYTEMGRVVTRRPHEL